VFIRGRVSIWPHTSGLYRLILIAGKLISNDLMFCTGKGKVLVWRHRQRRAAMSTLSQRLLQERVTRLAQLLSGQQRRCAVWYVCSQLHAWLLHFFLPSHVRVQVTVDGTVLHHTNLLLHHTGAAANMRWVDMEEHIVLHTDCTSTQ
jgi:hypothetical protein